MAQERLLTILKALGSNPIASTTKTDKTEKINWLTRGLIVLYRPNLKFSLNSPVLYVQVEIYKSFRPGDIVLAKVVSFILSKLLKVLCQ